ncbi:MAG: serine protease [Elusimicrobia bacterium]|nr:serine protease [Elusimicrobiota bacterium]
MKKLLIALLLPASALPAAAAQKTAGDKVIYGVDDRLDYFQAAPDMRKLADSVVSLWRASEVTPAAGGFRLSTENYGESMGLCQDEPFREQPIGAFCSGSLVGPDLVMTAGHCIRSEEDCSGTKFVFGFALKSAGDAPSGAASRDVYSCKTIVKRYLNESYGALGPDFALVRLDRPAEGRQPLGINRGAGPAKGDPMFVVGHPSGLPVKVAGGATVRDPSPDGYFVANLDTYGGNSGSPVFSARTGQIEGILVRGENDFVYRDGCRVSNVVPSDGGRGEDVTKVSALAGAIPAAAANGEVVPLPAPAVAPEEPERAQALLRTLSGAMSK